MLNNKVKAKLREEVALADKENEFTSGDIDSEPYVQYKDLYVLSLSAIKRYFESRKRLHRESQPEHRARVSLQEKQRKARSRRQRVSNVFTSILHNLLSAML